MTQQPKKQQQNPIKTVPSDSEEVKIQKTKS
jgi:hypothetical protein